MNLSIENNRIRITINEDGGELVSLYSKDHALEYLWQGSVDSWQGQSPHLFPIIGGLPEGKYTHRGKEYALPSHGFARKSKWKIEETEENKITATLANTPETGKVYPFSFELKCIYSIDKETLTVAYALHNTGEETLPFALGGHPGFNCPLEKGLSFTDYHLLFEEEETTVRFLKRGLLTGATIPFNTENCRMELHHDLFKGDALLFKNLLSKEMTLKADQGKRGITFSFPGFTHFGIWTFPAKPAPYICLEPWFGIDSTQGSSQDIKEKEGMTWLPPGNLFECSYRITLF